MPPDVETVMAAVKDDVKDKPQVREALNSKAVSIIGAEASMRSRLEKLENDRNKVLNKAAYRPEPKKPAAPQTVDLTGDQQMKNAPGKKAAKRENAEDAEVAETHDWSVVSEASLSPPKQ